MKSWTILAAALTLVIVPAWSAQADPVKDLQKLLTTNSCEGCDLSGVSLIGVDLAGAQLQGAKLNAANFSGADLSGANLTKVSAVGTSFVGANLQKTVLVKTSLIYANLAKVQLNEAILQGTDLQGANLAGADLSGAKIAESDFVGANLAEVKRSQPWLPSDKNRFQGDVRVSINQSVEPPVPIVGSPPTTAPGDVDSSVTGGSGTNTIRTRGGRVGNPERSRRRRYSIPAWIGSPQTSTAGANRYHDPQSPASILELW
jgi:Pentapeptide repeats (8 copies)